MPSFLSAKIPEGHGPGSNPLSSDEASAGSQKNSLGSLHGLHDTEEDIAGADTNDFAANALVMAEKRHSGIRSRTIR